MIQSIDDLPIRNYAKKRLRGMGIETLRKMSYAQISAIPGIGKSTATSIEEAFAQEKRTAAMSSAIESVDMAERVVLKCPHCGEIIVKPIL